MTRAIGISLAFHAIAIAILLAARGDGPERTPHRRVEHATYVAIEWPRNNATQQPPIPIPSGLPASGGYGVVLPPAFDPVAAAPATSGEGATPSGAPAPASILAGEADPGASSATAAGRMRLGPHLGDARLIVTPRGGGLAPEDADYLAEFHAALRAFNDSVQGRADRERRVRDWTWTDPRGRAWGVRDGMILIAGQPVGAGEITGDRDQELAARRLSRHREEIDFHADRVERERHVRERARAVRERRDGERAGSPR